MKLLQSLLGLALAGSLSNVLAAGQTQQQLNGVRGPYYDGVSGANQAEIAGILAVKEAIFDLERLTVFIALNEYRDGKLIRQSSCSAAIDTSRLYSVSILSDPFHTICYLAMCWRWIQSLSWDLFFFCFFFFFVL